MIEEMAAFLAARTDEDEALASRATPGPWTSRSLGRHDMSAVVAVGKSWRPGDFPDGTAIADTGSSRGAADAAHMSRHDPARALRQVQATRRLLRRYELALAAQNPPSVLGYIRAVGWGYIEAHEEAIRDAVAVYAEHPEYRPEWAREQDE